MAAKGAALATPYCFARLAELGSDNRDPTIGRALPLIRSLPLALALSLSLALPAAAEDPGRGFAGAFLAARHASFHSDYSAAAEYYTRALARDRNNPVLMENVVMAFIGLGEIDKAEPVARRMQSIGLESQIANMVLMGVELKAENYEGVVSGLDGPQKVGPLVDGLVRGWGLLGMGQSEEAMAAFDEASVSTGLSAFGLYHKALALAMVGDFEAADAVFSGESGDQLRLTRRGAIAHAQVLSQLGRNEAAIELIELGWTNDIDPGLEELLSRLKAGETIPFNMVRNVQDGLAEVFYTVAGALEGEASDAYTLTYARMAEYLRPDHVDAILVSATLLEQQEQYELATAAFNSVPRDDAGFHVAEMGRAAALRASGRNEAAIEVLEQLAETHGDIPIVQITLGDNLRAEERYEEAGKAYDAAIALFDEEQPGQWIVYYARGISRERTDRWAEAEADFRKALELNPGQPQVLNYLGYSLVEMQENLDEALEMIEEAVAASPGSGYIIDSLGWALYRLGRYDEAVGHMERATELMATDPIVNDHLGDVYWAVGRKIEAQFQWHRALSFDPEPEEAERIRRKLEVGLDVVLEEEGEAPLAVANGAH
ncbi:tetratricopeptide repeat protein [Tropicimonas sp. IMCC6043]|uniref:tetratricopeptide repeat protein n=1 Tax=Tropicimonas sp. IMCC6043 TaxID=2510645 RepID=UPI00101D0940|nr:tetratricopeptide repeat protein [Tropicimonas sp. IMCC6043]RYH08210.1 tetratricopeptide repeat protein [Tropicimonas sp. IMCC6043]